MVKILIIQGFSAFSRWHLFCQHVSKTKALLTKCFCFWRRWLCDLKRRALLGGSNLKAKRKRLSIVFATLFTAKQGVSRAECTEATADDYATGATRHLQKIPKASAFGIFLSKPQAWHIIAARSAVHIIKGGKPPLYLITRQRVFSCGLMICNTSCW